MRLLLPSRYNQQPPQPVVDQSSPLARGLVAYMPLAGKANFDVVDGSTWATAGTSPAAYDGAPRGLGLRVKGAAAAYVTKPIPAAISSNVTQQLTLRFRLYLKSLTTTSSIMSWGTGAQDGAPRFYARMTNNLLSFYYAGGYGNGINPATSVDREYIVHHTFDGVTHATYLNGVLVGTSLGAWSGNSSTLYLGSGFDGTNASTDFLLSDFALWNRALSASEAASDAQNPWQLFAAPRRLWAVAAGSGTDTPIRPGAGVLAITSYAPSIVQSANQSISPGVNALAVTSYAPSISQTANQALQPGANAIALTGYAPSITQSASQALQPTASALLITGYAPAVVRTDNQAVIPGASALAITGYAPTVAQGITTNINPATATLALSGYAPAIAQTANQALNPGAAAVALAGYAPTVSRTANLNLPLVAGALALTGYAPTITQAPPPADPRYARPSFDLAAGPWLPSAGSSLAAVLDEPSADAADFIKTTSPGICQVQLNPVVPPAAGTRQVVRYQAWSPTGDRLAVRLLQGSTLIASWSHEPAPLVETIFAQQLTAGQVAAISDWSALAFEFEAF